MIKIKRLFISFTSLILIFSLFSISTNYVLAQGIDPNACPFSGANNQCAGGCGSSQICIVSPPNCVCITSGGNTGNNPFGTIINPVSGGSLGPGGGLIALLNNVLRLIFVAAGIYAFLRIVIAGLGFIGAGGDAKKIEQAWSSIWQSILGVIIIISSLAIAALMGALLFGDATAILNPKIYGPG